MAKYCSTPCDVHEFPELLRSLYLGTHPKAHIFKGKERTYNNFLAMASTTMPRRALNKHGEPVMAVHGQGTHHQSHLFQHMNANHAAFAQY